MMLTRDQIALHVLPTVIDVCRHDVDFDGETHEQMFARKAYAIADAVLSESTNGMHGSEEV